MEKEKKKKEEEKEMNIRKERERKEKERKEKLEKERKEREEKIKTAIERAEALIDTLFPEDDNEDDLATDTTYIVEILKKSLRPLSQGDFKKIVINISKTLKVEIKFSNDSFTIKKEDKNIKGGAISC